MSEVLLSRGFSSGGFRVWEHLAVTISPPSSLLLSSLELSDTLVYETYIRYTSL